MRGGGTEACGSRAQKETGYKSPSVRTIEVPGYSNEKSLRESWAPMERGEGRDSGKGVLGKDGEGNEKEGKCEAQGSGRSLAILALGDEGGGGETGS